LIYKYVNVSIYNHSYLHLVQVRAYRKVEHVGRFEDSSSSDGEDGEGNIIGKYMYTCIYICIYI
jgi:hypothetical protein